MGVFEEKNVKAKIIWIKINWKKVQKKLWMM